MLYLSGYSSKERYNYIKGAIERRETMDKEVSEGKRESIYRKGTEIKEAKIEKGGLTPATWFLSSTVASTISCQATPGSTLARMLGKEVGVTSKGQRKLVLEEGGQPITLGLKARDPFSKPGCKFRDPQCIVKPNKDCSEMGLVYVIRCKTCSQLLDPSEKEAKTVPGGLKSSHYIGMTATSLHNRMLDHRNGQKRKSKMNVLYRHDLDKHEGMFQEYEAECIQTDRGLLHLCLREALLIEGQDPSLSINKKMEQGRGGIVRLNAVR